jgi:tRNA nucleotidyltransferase (CCA-adding enzyme)
MRVISLPGEVRHILDTLQANGHDAYIVGGCVRDCLMGIEPKDWDIATSALPAEVKDMFTHTFDTGIQHGTVTVVVNRINYEVTTYRIDGAYLDSRRPERVAFSVCLEDDLSRRDFTMNSVAYHPERGYADPFGGQADIKNRTIRCVGQPEQRFGEDALRMLRAVRFAAQLGFDIEHETLNAITSLKNRLVHISAERIREELVRLITSPYPAKADLLESTGLLPYMLAGRTFNGNLRHCIKQMESIPNETCLRLALFFSWAGDEAFSLLRDLRFDNKTIREVGTLIQLLPKQAAPKRYEIKLLMHKTSPSLVRNLFLLQHAVDALEILEDILEKKECFTYDALAVTGGHLIGAGFEPGKTLGSLLAQLMDLVMRDPAMNKHEVLTGIAKGLV